MIVHHLNCISACPLGGRLMDGVSGARLRGSLVCHCLLLETAKALVLVDTGYGLRDVAAPRSRLNPVFLALMRPELREEMTAARQIVALGFDPADVRHIVLTHLDFDHAGGLDDFPEAEVHLLESERAAAQAQETLLDRMRYRPQQWSSLPRWRTYSSSSGETWFDFERVQTVDGLSDEVLLIPLPGHTLGHAGVAVRRDRDWLLQAGDAYFYHAELDPEAVLHARAPRLSELDGQRSRAAPSEPATPARSQTTALGRRDHHQRPRSRRVRALEPASLRRARRRLGGSQQAGQSSGRVRTKMYRHGRMHRDSLRDAGESSDPAATPRSYGTQNLSRGAEPAGSDVMAQAGKGKPTKQVADERKEREAERPDGQQPARTIHRLDRSQSDEKGGKGAGNVERARREPTGGQQPPPAPRR